MNTHGVEPERDPVQAHQVECGVLCGFAESVDIQRVLILVWDWPKGFLPAPESEGKCGEWPGQHLELRSQWSMGKR